MDCGLIAMVDGTEVVDMDVDADVSGGSVVVVGIASGGGDGGGVCTDPIPCVDSVLGICCCCCGAYGFGG